MYVYQIWELNHQIIVLKGHVMFNGGGKLEVEFLPGVDVRKNAEDWGAESKSKVLLSELRDKLLISTGSSQ